MVNKTVLFGKKSRGWDGSKGRSKFALFQVNEKAYNEAVKAQDWDKARLHGQRCLDIEIDDFRVHEIEAYNRVIRRIENGVKSLPAT